MHETNSNLIVESVWDADSQQAIFRELMDAMSRPGSIKELSHWLGDTPAHRGVLATLLDNEVSLSDPQQLLDKNDWPLLQVKTVITEQADYILCDGQHPALIEPKLGTLPSPDFSATLVITIAHLGEGSKRLKLTGPGVNQEVTLQLDGLHKNWLEKREDWNAAFPLGVDIILTDASKIVALPRTTKVEVL